MSAKKASKTVKGRATTTRSKARRPSVKIRARAIIADAKGYDEETRRAIRNTRDEGASDLAELVRRAEGGETILDVTGHTEADDRAAAIAYAKAAYNAALAHFEKHSADPFARSRLAVVFGETTPGDVHMVVTLPGRMRDSAVGDEDVRRWISDAEMLARTLEHPECTEAFKSAFGAIYTEHLLDGSRISWTSPEVLRVMLPLVMLAGSGTNHVCDDHTALDILKRLSSELMSDHAGDEVRAFFLRAPIRGQESTSAVRAINTRGAHGHNSETGRELKP